MKKFLITATIFSLIGTGAAAQYNTNCTKDYFGNFSCNTQPSDIGFIDFGSFQRGAQQANQERQQQQMMLQQIEIQQRMLEQQQQMRLQNEYQIRLQQEQHIKLLQTKRLQQEEQVRLQQEQQARLQQEQQVRAQQEQQARLVQDQKLKREQEQALLQQPERLQEINLEKSTPEWQLGQLYSRADNKGLNGSTRCSYRTSHGFIFVKGKRYESFDHDIPNATQCPAQLHVSKFTGRGCTESCLDGAVVSPFRTTSK